MYVAYAHGYALNRSNATLFLVLGGHSHNYIAKNLYVASPRGSGTPALYLFIYLGIFYLGDFKKKLNMIKFFWVAICVASTRHRMGRFFLNDPSGCQLSTLIERPWYFQG